MRAYLAQEEAGRVPDPQEGTREKIRQLGNNKTYRVGHVSLEEKQEQLREQRATDEIKICV